MNLAVSNIAWRNEEEEKVAKLLQELEVKYVEVALTKLWDDPTKASDEEINRYVGFWKSYGIEIIAFQSMLFGREHLSIFEEGVREDAKKFLKDFIVLAGKMGAKKMVFGSPKNRQRKELSAEQAIVQAKEFFTDIADTAQEYDVIFCIEPNPTDYACDFITSAAEGADFVRLVDHPNFKLHLDIAGMTLAGDDISVSVSGNIDILAHTHISAPMLGDVPSEDVDYESFISELQKAGFTGMKSIEMRPQKESNISRVRTAVEYCKQFLHGE